MWRRASGPSRRGAVPVTTRFSLLRERTAAAARLRRVRVHEDESLLYQRLVVIERQSVQINERLWVDKNPHIVELKHAVTLARLRIEPYVVAQARASATLHA